MFVFNLINFLVAYLTFCAGGVINISDEDVGWDNFDHSLQINDAEYIADSGAANTYWLYTRKNPDVPQTIVHGSPDTILESNYDANKPLKVIVHGWGGSINSLVNKWVKSSYLKVADVNIIVVDWGLRTPENYISACLRVPSTGRYLGNLIDWLFNAAGGDWEAVHLIGYSLGAHVVGNAGREVGGKAKRITGLDPAGPLWWGNNSYALNSDDGQYVEAIHTNLLRRGTARAIGHVDFYPNGGRTQPGCSDVDCSHDRAYELFASSIENDHLIGRQCANVLLAIVGKCYGSTLAMGNGDLLKTGHGIYTLPTRDVWPF